MQNNKITNLDTFQEKQLERLCGTHQEAIKKFQEANEKRKKEIKKISCCHNKEAIHDLVYGKLTDNTKKFVSKRIHNCISCFNSFENTIRKHISGIAKEFSKNQK